MFTPTICLGAAHRAVLLPALFTGLATVTTSHGFQHCLKGTSAACAMIGMAAFLGACTQAPVMAMLMVFEMTLDDNMILPLMLACVVSYTMVRRLRCPALYSMGGKRHERALAKPAWSELRVRDLVKPTGPVVTNDAPFAEVASSFASHQFNFIFVQDKGGIYRGAIAIQDIKEYLHDDRLGNFAIAEDLRVPLAALVRDDELPKALEAFARHPGNRLPVVDENARMVGCVHKYDVMLAFAHGGIASGMDTPANGVRRRRRLLQKSEALRPPPGRRPTPARSAPPQRRPPAPRPARARPRPGLMRAGPPRGARPGAPGPPPPAHWRCRQRRRVGR